MIFGHCHRTRFRDSFCLASVFEMTVYLLTYLLTKCDRLENDIIQGWTTENRRMGRPRTAWTENVKTSCQARDAPSAHLWCWPANRHVLQWPTRCSTHPGRTDDVLNPCHVFRMAHMHDRKHWKLNMKPEVGQTSCLLRMKDRTMKTADIRSWANL